MALLALTRQLRPTTAPDNCTRYLGCRELQAANPGAFLVSAAT